MNGIIDEGSVCAKCVKRVYGFFFSLYRYGAALKSFIPSWISLKVLIFGSHFGTNERTKGEKKHIFVRACVCIYSLDLNLIKIRENWVNWNTIEMNPMSFSSSSSYFHFSIRFIHFNCFFFYFPSLPV